MLFFGPTSPPIALSQTRPVWDSGGGRGAQLIAIYGSPRQVVFRESVTVPHGAANGCRLWAPRRPKGPPQCRQAQEVSPRTTDRHCLCATACDTHGYDFGVFCWVTDTVCQAWHARARNRWFLWGSTSCGVPAECELTVTLHSVTIGCSGGLGFVHQGIRQKLAHMLNKKIPNPTRAPIGATANFRPT